MATFATLPDAVNYSRDPINILLEKSSSDPSPRFRIQLTIQDPTNPLTLAEFWQYGEGYNNLSDRLNAWYKESNAYFPGWGASTLHYTYVLQKYTIVVSEYTGSPLTEYGTAITSEGTGPLFMMHGGLTFNKIYDPSFNLYTRAQTPQIAFQTTAPNNKITRTDMKEYLTFLFYDTLPASFYTRVRIVFTDGTSTNYSITQTTAGVAAWDMQAWRVPSSYSALDIASHLGGKVAWYYEVYISDSVNVHFTETRRYYLDYKKETNIRKIVWRNSQGGEDSFYFTGNEKFNTEITQRSTNNYVVPFYNVMYGQRTVSNRREQITIKTGTWLSSREMANWLRDMRLSEFIYEDSADVGYLPIEILPGTFNIYDAEKTGYQIEFEYQYRFNNHSYTP